MKKTYLNWMMVAACCLSLTGLQAQGMVGVSIFNADTEVDGVDAGSGPYGLLRYTIEDAAGNLSFEVGSGSADGNGVDLTRTEFALLYSLVEDTRSVGVGARYMLQDINDLETQYLGPEITMSAWFPMGDSLLSPFVEGGLGMYLYSTEPPGGGDEDGSVIGYNLKFGVAYTVDAIQMRVGYRLQNMDGDGSTLPETEMSGLFLDIGFWW